MGKLIIDNRSNKINDAECLSYVSKVIDEGRISGSQGNEQYCYLSIFGSGSDKIGVSTDLNKNSDRFIVYDAK